MIKQLFELANDLDNSGLHKEADELEKIGIALIVKTSGQIPAGMHRSILQTGLFGESEYDELDWIRRESEKGIKKLLEKNPRSKKETEKSN